MNRRTGIYTLGLLTVLCTLAIVSAASAASWTDFGTAQFSGITFDKPLQVNVLDYTLTVSDHPTVTVGSHTYQVNWIQSVYVVSGTPGGTFTASGPASKGWSWDSKTSGGGQISGWTGQGNNRLYAGQSRMFHFSAFNPNGNPVTVGYHISYNDGQNVVTDWFKRASTISPIPVPEPSPILCIGVAIVGMFAHVRRRRA